MMKRRSTALDVAVGLGVGALILVAILFARGLTWGSHARATQAVINRFAQTLAQ